MSAMNISRTTILDGITTQKMSICMNTTSERIYALGVLRLLEKMNTNETGSLCLQNSRMYVSLPGVPNLNMSRWGGGGGGGIY